MKAGSAINVSTGSFTAQLPAQSVTTFVGEFESAETPTPTMTPTPTKIQTTPVISVDINKDGVVNMADVILLATKFNSTKGDGKYVDSYDLNRDGAINMADVIMIAASFNKSF